MTPTQFKDALATLGWNQSEFARKVGVTANTASRYALGAAPIPRWVERHLNLLLDVRRLGARFIAPGERGQE